MNQPFIDPISKSIDTILTLPRDVDISQPLNTLLPAFGAVGIDIADTIYFYNLARSSESPEISNLAYRNYEQSLRLHQKQLTLALHKLDTEELQKRIMESMFSPDEETKQKRRDAFTKFCQDNNLPYSGDDLFQPKPQ
jgi:hypothetical protein